MPSSTTFTGIPFTVSSVAANSTVTAIRVLFSAEPKHTNAYSADDALNSANYTLVGPTARSIIGVATVSGQPEAIDLILDGQLTVGTWTVYISSTIVSSTATSLSGTFSFSFTVASVPVLPTGVAPGTNNDTAEDLIRSHLSPAFAGSAWDALIAAVATGDAYVFDNAAKAFYQLFTPTAEGKYLDARGSERGVARPHGLGMGDELYRQYISAMTNSQVTLPAAWKLLKVFWGKDAVSGYVTSTTEPFSLVDGQTISFLSDKQNSLTVTFVTNDFNAISAASVDEVCAVINKQARDNRIGISAAPVIDPVTGFRKVRAYSDTIGSESFMSCTGGMAQNALRFETALTTTAGFPIAWTITKPTVSTVKFATTSTNAILDNVGVGDYVNLTPFTYSGTYTVTEVSVSRVSGLSQYFVFESDESFGAAYSQTAASEIAFYRPDSFGLPKGFGAVSVGTSGDGLTVEVPATANTVGRTPQTGGAYCKANPAATNTDAISKWTNSLGRCEHITVVSAGHGTANKSVIEDSFVSGLTPPAATTSFDQPSQSGGLGKPDVRRWHVLGGWGNDPRWYSQSLPFSEQDIVVAGGIIDSTPTWALDCIQIHLDGTDYSYSTTPGLAEQVILAAGATVPVGEADEWSPVLFGGLDSTSGATSYVQKMNPSTHAWTGTGAFLSASRYNCKAVWVPELRSFFVGPGFDGSTEISDCDYVSPGNVWATSATAMNPMAVQLYGFDNIVDVVTSTVTAITGGKVSGVATAHVEYVDHGGSPDFNVQSDMLFARYNHASIVIGDRVLVACGTGRKGTHNNDPDGPLSAVEISSSSLGVNAIRWTRMPNTNRAHAWAKMVRLSDTEILLVGSRGAEVLDLRTMRWTHAGFDESLTWGITEADVSTIGGYAFALNSTTLAAAYRPNVVMAPGAKRLGIAGSCGIHPTVSASSSIYEIPQYSTDFFSPVGASCGTHTKLTARVDASVPGPYLFDPEGSVAATGITSTVTSAITQNLGVITLADASLFPQTGHIVVGLGYDYQSGPIEFFSKTGNSIAIDSRHTFSKAVPSGASVTLLLQKEPYTPEHKDGALYLAPSARGRVAAVESLQKIMAAGVGLDVSVTYPGDRGLGKEGTEQSDKTYVWGNDEL